jgi:predicted phosphodiesterase
VDCIGITLWVALLAANAVLWEQSFLRKGIPMRLAVFSDIHGNLVAFEAALSDFEALGGADYIWILGDLAAFGPRPAECVRRVKAMVDAAEADEAKKGTVRAIRGNTDRYLVTGASPEQRPAENAEALEKMLSGLRRINNGLLWALEQLTFEDYEFLSKLGGECDLHAEGYGYVIGYHGTPGNDEGVLSPKTSEEEASDALLDREGRLGIGGHIHIQMDRLLERSGWRVINVGSIGMSKDMPGRAQWGLFTFENRDVTVDLRAVPYDVDAVIADLNAVGFPSTEWAASVLRSTSP